jgi:dTDP-4-dehydrorhamnose reductase
MRILVLGGSGMLGHKLCQVADSEFETAATVRGAHPEARDFGMPETVHVVGGVEAEDLSTVRRAIEQTKPDAVINCVGIVKQAPEAQDPAASITINALFPHQLAHICSERNTRLIHLSTDCVFSGRKGNYSESDVSDAEDLYGRSKYLGEVDRPHCVTIRTSMIGRELRSSNGLLEWFLAQRGKNVRGFRESIFSGFTTRALSAVILDVVLRHPELAGVWHVAANPISKYDLLCLIRDAYGLEVAIEPDDTVVCDRSLDGSRFSKATGYVPSSWRAMIEEMAADPTPYEELRRQHAGG